MRILRAYIFTAAAIAAVALPPAGLAAPANDNFGSAQAIGGATGTVNGTNVGATKQAGEPNHAGNRGGKSVWFVWTAPAKGTAVFHTDGSDFDTLLAVYVGTSVSALREVRSDDDSLSSTSHTSILSFTAVKDTVYRIAVDGFHEDAVTASGSVQLSWNLVTTRPSNDDFSARRPLSGAVGSVAGNNEAAAYELGEPRHVHPVFNGGASVWYDWQAPSDGVAEFDTNGSAIDTLYGAYVGDRVDGLARAAAGMSRNGPMRLRARAGQVYRIAVDGDDWTTEMGDLVLNWSLAPGTVANDDFAAATPLVGTGGSVAGTNAGASTEAGEPVHARAELNGASVWYRWTAPAYGVLTVRTAGSDFDTLLGVYNGTSVGRLVEVGSNDDRATGDATSRVRIPVVANRTYAIAVDGYFADTGTVSLRWSFARCTITGTASGETLTGTAEADAICGLGGADTIRGAGGNDLLVGGYGADYLLGGSGDDWLLARDGVRDRVDGGLGTDRARIDAGVDALVSIESVF